MSRALVTHFDGDPFLLNFWLLIYERFFRTETNKVYLSLNAGHQIPQSIIEFNDKLLARYPEITVRKLVDRETPEVGNQLSLADVTEDHIGLVESDGFIFAQNLVDQMFRLMENDGQDIVSPPWPLIEQGTFSQGQGFMRCFFFIKKSLLDQIDINFLPHTIPSLSNKEISLDCFGWICWQLYNLEPKITYTPANVITPTNILDSNTFNQYKWCHVRQMSSSALGMGGGGFYDWMQQDANLVKSIQSMITHEFVDGSAQFTYLKAVAFKLLMLDCFTDKGSLTEFAENYKMVLELVIDALNLPIAKLYEIKGFYKGTMNL